MGLRNRPPTSIVRQCLRAIHLDVDVHDDCLSLIPKCSTVQSNVILMFLLQAISVLRNLVMTFKVKMLVSIFNLHLFPCSGYQQMNPSSLTANTTATGSNWGGISTPRMIMLSCLLAICRLTIICPLYSQVFITALKQTRGWVMTNPLAP